MNTTTRIIAAAFTTMLLCTAVAAFTYEPMLSRSDYDDHRSYQDVYTKRAMDDYQKIADDRRPPAQSKRIEDSELERTIQKQIEKHERAPYGIPKQRERVSYGPKPSYNDLPDAYPNDVQTPGLHLVSVLVVIVASVLLLRRRS